MTLEKCRISADFLEHPSRPLFHVLLEPAEADPVGAILFCPPFADEMHMSRHIVASCARALVQSGFVVMLPDLTGCGDGSGEFSDSSWSVWREDTGLALDALKQRFNLPVSLWGLRSGGLMATQVAVEESGISQLLLWQPVLNGEQQIDQFLRLQSAASALGSGEAFDRGALWAALRKGESLEVAGYLLPSQLAMEMADVRLSHLKPACPVYWVDVTATGAMTPGARKAEAAWREGGITLNTDAVVGEPFWRAIDAKVNTALQQRTVQWFASA